MSSLKVMQSLLNTKVLQVTEVVEQNGIARSQDATAQSLINLGTSSSCTRASALPKKTSNLVKRVTSALAAFNIEMAVSIKFSYLGGWALKRGHGRQVEFLLVRTDRAP